MSKAYVDITGRRFGRLVVRETRKVAGFRRTWLCICDCGNEKVAAANYLKAGLILSCGCLSRPHGMSKSAEYAIWAGMQARCSNPNVVCFADYGGRGIRVCERWRGSFLNFYADMGPRPSPKHSLERNDPNGDYEPCNVRWATTLEQSNNKRNTRFVVYRGERMSLTNAVRAAGSVVHHEAAWIRIKTGWDVERSVSTPRMHESPNSKFRRGRSVKAMGVPA